MGAVVKGHTRCSYPVNVYSFLCSAALGKLCVLMIKGMHMEGYIVSAGIVSSTGIIVFRPSISRSGALRALEYSTRVVGIPIS